MRKSILAVLLLVTSLVVFAKDNDKQKVINKVWKALGGKANFEQSRYFEFTFEVKRNDKIAVSRKHLWDRYTGDYRFEQEPEKGKVLTVLFNVNTKKGTAYENGVAIADSLNTKAVNRAYASFINDTYWLMVPFKLEDPGVNTALEADEVINKVKYNIIHLNFDKVGLTPGDQYWLYVNKKTGAIDKWKFLLQNQKNTSSYDWAPYTEIGNNLKLSTAKTSSANNGIFFPVAKALKEVDPIKFTKP